MGNLKEAEDRFKILATIVPSDPGVFQRLGAIYAKNDDDLLAHQHYMEVFYLSIYLPIYLVYPSFLNYST